MIDASPAACSARVPRSAAKCNAAVGASDRRRGARLRLMFVCKCSHTKSYLDLLMNRSTKQQVNPWILNKKRERHNHPCSKPGYPMAVRVSFHFQNNRRVCLASDSRSSLRGKNMVRSSGFLCSSHLDRHVDMFAFLNRPH